MASGQRTLECPMCKRMMRSDNLRRHWRKKHKMFDMKLTVKVESNATDSESASTSGDLKMEILDNAKVYDEKIKLGENIFNVLMETNTKEDSLSRRHKEAFDLYQSKKLALNVDDDIKLFPWQNELLNVVQNKTYREIFWVKGAPCNEGKTWFQNYVQSYLGIERVVQLDLKNSVGNIMQVLRKLPLSSVDTFLFNDARSGQSEMQCYKVLENIKDGKAIASKYASEIIRFRTPNVVIVFSNVDPDMTQLSKDRWRVFYINKGGLSSQEKRLWELKNTKKSLCLKCWI